MGLWMVPLANVLAAHGMQRLLPWVLTCNGISAFISPLIAGALADQRIPPTRLLRWMALGSAIFLSLTSIAIERGWSSTAVLVLAQIMALFSTPTWSTSTAIVLSHLVHAKTQFGPIRAWATIGWMAGGWLISLVLHADSSTLAGQAGAACWLLVVFLTLLLPEVMPPDRFAHRSWKQILGLDALGLLSHRDHRVVFVTAALYSAPLAAFYPYAARHLHEIGVNNVSAVMSLGQITEVLVMLGLAGLLGWVRLKWIFLSGIAFGVLRYGWFILDTKNWLIAGVIVHGLAYTLYFITTQIYLEDRIDPKLRARAQALLTLLMSGVGSLAGYVGSGWWHHACTPEGAATDWPRFWTGLTLTTGVVFAFFAVMYRGRVHLPESGAAKQPSGA